MDCRDKYGNNFCISLDFHLINLIFSCNPPHIGLAIMQKYLLILAKVIIAIILLGSGGAKLAGIPELHESFRILGLPEWFGYLIGTCEISGAIGLFIRPLSALASVGIFLIMAGAMYFHVMHTPLTQGIPALVVLILSLFVVFKTKGEMLKFS